MNHSNNPCNASSGFFVASNVNVYASNDNVLWVDLIKNHVPSTKTFDASWDIDMSGNNDFYRYYKVEATSFTTYANHGWEIQRMTITGKEIIGARVEDNIWGARCPSRYIIRAY